MKNLILLLLFITSFSSYSQTEITDSNFQDAIDICLSTNPVDGMCSVSEYGAMPSWNVSNVTNMSEAFKERSDFNADISNWNVSSVNDMSNMFQEATAFNADISAWDVSNVTNMSETFKNITTFNGDLSSWDVGNVTDMSYMFYVATAFNQDLSAWDVSSVTDMNGMFYYAAAFNQPIGNWDVSSVTDMYAMFYVATAFNQPIGDWDVSSVNDMSYMFIQASAFNQNISSWCVTNIASEPSNFSTGSPLSESNKPVWGSCSTAGVDDLTQLDISIYPNPTSDIVYIDGNYTQLKVVIYNILGKEVINKSITNSIDISHLENGVYLMKLSDGFKLYTRKVIKN